MEDRLAETGKRLDQMVEQYEQAMEALRPVFEALHDAILKIWHILVRIVRKIIECLKRWLFYVQLIRWHCPHWLAKFLSRHWPRRWLPSFGFG